MANFYISDLHIGCMNKYEGRTLETDQKLKENWNKVVTNADTIYILGDVGRAGTNKDNEYLASYLAALKGKKVLVKGNHDRLDDIRIKHYILTFVIINIKFHSSASFIILSFL